MAGGAEGLFDVGDVLHHLGQGERVEALEPDVDGVAVQTQEVDDLPHPALGGAPRPAHGVRIRPSDLRVMGNDLVEAPAVHAQPVQHLHAALVRLFHDGAHLAAALAIRDELIPALRTLHASLVSKGEEFMPVVKTGRTHLQDATPIRLGQEFQGYAGQVERGLRRLEAAAEELREVALGGMTVYRRPVAFVRELLRRELSPKDLMLLCFTAGFESDLLVGAGCVGTVRSVYFGLESFGLAPMFTEFAQQGRINIMEETEASIVMGMRATMADVGFMPSNAWIGTEGSCLRARSASPPILTISSSTHSSWPFSSSI